MKALVIAVFTIAGGSPVTTVIPATECKPAMEQAVKSYGMTSYIKSWSNSSVKAEKDKTRLVVTCTVNK